MNKIKKLETLVAGYRQEMQQQTNLEKFTCYDITCHSTAIEGSTLSEAQVRHLLDLDMPARNRTFTEHLMVTDHHKALVFAINQATKRAPLTESLIQEIGAAVMKNTGSTYRTALGDFDSTKGDYRLLSVSAGTRRFPDSKKVPALMKTLVADINTAIPAAKTFAQQCELAFELHFRLVNVHPFADGNGRTSRLMMNYLLQLFELPVFYVASTKQTEYIYALEKARTNHHIACFNDFMYAQYQKFLMKMLKKNRT